MFGLPKFSGRKAKICEAYQLEKQHRLPFPNKRNRSRNKLDLIHSDVLWVADTSSLSSTTKRGTHGSSSLRGGAKSSTVSGTSKGSWKPKRNVRSSACGRMAEKSTFPINSTVIYNKWEFDASSVVDIRQSRTAWPRGRIGQLWRRHRQCWRRRAYPSSTRPRRKGPQYTSRTGSETKCRRMSYISE